MAMTGRVQKLRQQSLEAAPTLSPERAMLMTRDRMQNPPIIVVNTVMSLTCMELV